DMFENMQKACKHCTENGCPEYATNRTTAATLDCLLCHCSCAMHVIETEQAPVKRKIETIAEEEELQSTNYNSIPEGSTKKKNKAENTRREKDVVLFKENSSSDKDNSD